jgi:protein-disulfide isomerase
MALLKTPVTARDHWRGDPDAPVVLVEYGDYQCPFCAAAHPNLALVFRHFPLSEAHPLAFSAAQTAEFAGERNRYAEKIRSDFLSGVRSGVNGTPCFFINGVRHDGAWSFDELAAAIQAAQMHPPPAQPPLHGYLHGYQ